MIEPAAEDELVRRGRQIAAQLQPQAGLLEQWMAHYLAELLDRYECEGKDPSGETARRCADIITRLWEIRVQEGLARVQYELSRLGQESSPDPERLEQIGRVLAAPEGAAIRDLGAGGAVTLWDLIELEKLVLHAWYLAESLQAAEPDIRGAVDTLLDDPDWRIRRLKELLGRAFPSFRELDFTDKEAVETAATDALHAIQTYRCGPFWSSEDETEEEPDDATQAGE